MSISPARRMAMEGRAKPADARANDDFYATQRWVTRALCRVETFSGGIWEPACGEGDMALVLREELPNSVDFSDLVDRGFGPVRDFLAASQMQGGTKNIVTNPPFKLLADFIEHAVFGLKAEKACFLAPLYFLEGGRRHQRIFSKHPPARVWTFVERPAFKRGGRAEESARGVQAFAWAVWEREPPADGMYRGGWLTPQAAPGRQPGITEGPA